MFHEIKWIELVKKEEEDKGKIKSISCFCGDFLYDPNGCQDSKCKRIHTRDLAKMCYYLQEFNLKQEPCKLGNQCKYYMCRFYHSIDRWCLGSSIIGNDTLVLYDITHRRKKQIEWKESRKDIQLIKGKDLAFFPSTRKKIPYAQRIAQQTICV